MKNTKRKGFTIVELVIVIAVIAILAAVLIPTFASLINKANRSADIQAVHQMNTALAVNEVTEGKTITDVYEALSDAGMSAKDYTSLASNTYFFWDSELNRILYTDSDYKVTYPEEYKDNSEVTHEKHQWFSLNGKIKEDPVTPDSDGTYKISTAEQFYWVANQVTNKELTGDIKISLDEEKIDLMGANVTFDFKAQSGVKNFTLEGVNRGTAIVGLSQLSYNKTDVENNKVYCCGLISTADTGVGTGEVKLSNVTIKNSVVGDLETGSVGALIGSVSGAATAVTIENCKVEDTVVYGKNKVGGLIGQIGSGKVNISNCSLNGTTVNTSEGESGIVIGALYNTADLTIDKNFSEFAKGCTLKLIDGKFDRKTFEANTYAPKFGDNSTGVPAGTYFVEAKRKDGAYDGKYRMYVPGAYATVVYTVSNGGTYLSFTVSTTAKISDVSYEYTTNTKVTYNNNVCLLLYTAITE